LSDTLPILVIDILTDQTLAKKANGKMGSTGKIHPAMVSESQKMGFSDQSFISATSSLHEILTRILGDISVVKKSQDIEQRPNKDI
jgi:hypothetical protein